MLLWTIIYACVFTAGGLAGKQIHNYLLALSRDNTSLPLSHANLPYPPSLPSRATARRSTGSPLPHAQPLPGRNHRVARAAAATLCYWSDALAGRSVLGSPQPRPERTGTDVAAATADAQPDGWASLQKAPSHMVTCGR